MSNQDRETARAVFAAAAARGANVAPLLAELERDWKRQDELANRIKIGDITGGTWWTVPWGIWREGDESAWVNPDYPAWNTAGGTAKVKLERHDGIIHAYVPKGCELGPSWGKRLLIVLHEGKENA